MNLLDTMCICLLRLARDLNCGTRVSSLPLRLSPRVDAGIYGYSNVSDFNDGRSSRQFELYTSLFPGSCDIVSALSPKRIKNNFSILPLFKEQTRIENGAVGKYKHFIYRHFSKISPVDINSLEELSKKWEIDAWITGRNTGFIWCLSNPNYVTIDYKGLIGKAYFSYPIREESYQFISFMNNWLVLKEFLGISKRSIRLLVSSENRQKPQPRWSILRNVFHVGD